MQEYIEVTGIVLKQLPVKEYDRQLVLLTKERGKISAFANGARKSGNKLSAATCPFAYGTFKLYEGRSSYTVKDADITQYFEKLRTDYEGACYGMYFAEIAEYVAMENNDELEVMKLLYQSLRALEKENLPNPLVRAVYELKTVMVQGEFPGIPGGKEYQASTQYAIHYIETTGIEKLYTFTVSDDVLTELQEIAERVMKGFTNHSFRSLKVLENLC